jgi:hypothetical protein
LGKKAFDPLNWTPNQDPRMVVFFFESPDPFMLPSGSTFGFILDREIEWLKNIRMQPVEGVSPVPEEGTGRLSVSFRFWRSTARQEPPTPSDALMEIIRRVMPADKTVATSVGIVGLGDPPGEWPDQSNFQHREQVEGEPVETASEDYSTDQPEMDVTIIEAVTLLLPSEHDASPIVEALHRCMESFTEFSRVYRLSNKLAMHPITYERLPPTVFWATRKLANEKGNQWDQGFELLVFPTRMPGRTHHPELGEEGLQKLKVFYEHYRGGNPMIPYSERTLDARLSFDSLGDYTNCVIQCQTAVEVLFDALLSLLLWEEKMEPKRVAREIFSDKLHKRVRTHFGPRLGGDWNTKGRGAVGRWAQYLVPLRNRTVHTAHRPTRSEASNALAVVTDLDDFFRARLADKRSSYMRTALMVLGRPGLERQGVWSGKIRRFAERADEEPNWDHSFRQWQEQVMAAREETEDRVSP